MRIVYFILLCLSFSVSRSQVPNVNVGDQSPDFALQNIINYRSAELKISDFRDKLLILDFWATWCNPCIAAFPKVDSLQKIFEEKVQIMPVTYQDKNTVSEFMSKMNSVLKVSMPSVTGDTVLQRAFKHTFIPHYVWINKGIVIATSDAGALTRINISDVLEGRKRSFVNKIDIHKNVNMNNPMFALSNPVIIADSVHLDPLIDSNERFHSIATGYIEGISSGSTNEPERVTISNLPLVALYKFVAGRFDLELYSSNRVLVEIKDSARYQRFSGDAVEKLHNAAAFSAFLKENGVCYEIKLPSNFSEKRKWELVDQDVKRYFGDIYGIEAVKEKRPAKCLVLERISKDNKLASKGGEVEQTDNAFNFHLRNASLSWLTYRLNTYYLQGSSLSVLDESSYKDNVDMDITCNLSDVKSLNKELFRYGLKLTEAIRPIEMLVIRDKTIP